MPDLRRRACKPLRFVGLALMVSGAAAQSTGPTPSAPSATPSDPSSPTTTAAPPLSTSSSPEQATSPYYIGIRQGFTRDSNLFRSPPGTEASDTISATSLVAGIDQPLGRQRFFADASVQHNRFKEQTQLDSTGYEVNLGADLSTIEHISGTLRYTANRSLADYGDPNAPADIRTRNLQDIRRLAALARYGVTSRLALEASGERRSVDFSAPEFATRAYTQNVGTVGVKYGLESLLVFGAAVRFSKTDTPDYSPTYPPLPGTLVGDEADRRDIDLTANWSPTGFSTILARISFGEEEHTHPGLPGFSGVTGGLDWTYRYSPRLTTSVSLRRDTGTETTFARLIADESLSAIDRSRLNNSLGLGARYELTAKIDLNANARYTTTAVSGASDDATTLLSLDASYAPTRSITLDCGVGRERRSAPAASSGYTATTLNCAAQFTLR